MLPLRDILDGGRQNAMIHASVMGRRKDADRAEAIVKGVGAIIVLLLLFIAVQFVPQMVKGKDPKEAISIMVQLIAGIAFLMVLVGVIGLVVWVKVRNRRK